MDITNTYVSPSSVINALPRAKVKGARVTLINMPIREQAKPNNPPLGLALLAARLREWGAIPSIIDLNSYRIDDEQALRRGLTCGRSLTLGEANDLIDAHLDKHGDQDLIALSGLITTLKWQSEIATIVRQIQPKTVLAVGGGLATEFREILYDWIPELDAIAHSEGDDVILKMAADAKLIREKGAIAAERSGQLEPYSRGVVNGRVQFFYDGGRPQSLDDLPYPAYDLIEKDVNGYRVLDAYMETPVWGLGAQNSSATSFKMKRSLSTVSSRGCPFACRFCFRGAQGERNYGIRSAKDLAGEMEYYVKNYGVDFVGLVDDNFMVSRKRIHDLSKTLQPVIQETGLRWGTHGRLDEAADLYRKPGSDEVVQHSRRRVDDMAESGCIYIGFGAESASPAVLDKMGKGGFMLAGGTVKINGFEFPRTMVDGIRNTRNAGIHGNCTWIMGYPGETLEDLKTSAAFIGWQMEDITSGLMAGTPEYEQMKSSINSRMFTATAYPGTEMFNLPIVRKKLSEIFGIRFDKRGKPIPDEAFRTYVLELNDATKLLMGADGEPLNFSEVPQDKFVEARRLTDEGRTLEILDL